MRRRSTPSLILAAVVLALIPAAPSEAQIIGLTEYAVDFTKPKEAVLKARWDDTDLFRLSAKGFGRIDNPAGTREVTLRTSEPIALGTWWRPTGNASIQVVIEWAGKHAGDVPGDVHVSYSCDASSWSDWQLVPETRASKTKTTRVHNTVLQVPRHARQSYWEALARWGNHEEGVAWDSDEEAFVTWHRERHPTAFTKTRPFIGYVRFMYETEVPHGTWITGLNVDVTWVVSGISSVPSKAIEAIQEKRRDEPWSWRADGSHTAPEGSTARSAAERGACDAALRFLIKSAYMRQEARTNRKPPPYDCLVLRSRTVGIVDLLTLPEKQQKPLRAHLGGVSRELARDFHDQSSRSAPVPMGLDPGCAVYVVPADRLRAMQDAKGRHDWDRHARRWPGSFGVIALSGIGLSPDRTEALLLVSRERPGQPGYDVLCRLAKKDGAWRVVGSKITRYH